MSYPKSSLGSAGPFIIFPDEVSGSIQVSSCRGAACACADTKKIIVLVFTNWLAITSASTLSKRTTGAPQQLHKAISHAENILTLFKTRAPVTLLPLLVPHTMAAVVDCCLESAMQWSSHSPLSQSQDSCSPWTGMGALIAASSPRTGASEELRPFQELLRYCGLALWNAGPWCSRALVPLLQVDALITAEHFQPALKDSFHDRGPSVIWSACSPRQQVLLLRSLHEKKAALIWGRQL